MTHIDPISTPIDAPIDASVNAQVLKDTLIDINELAVLAWLLFKDDFQHGKLLLILFDFLVQGHRPQTESIQSLCQLQRQLLVVGHLSHLDLFPNVIDVVSILLLGAYRKYYIVLLATVMFSSMVILALLIV